jgi:hypothetical protein
MNKIALQQPVILRRRVGRVFMSSTSLCASVQEYELCELSPVSAPRLAFLLYRMRNVRTWRDVQSVVPVSANTLHNEDFKKNMFHKVFEDKIFVTHI